MTMHRILLAALLLAFASLAGAQGISLTGAGGQAPSTIPGGNFAQDSFTGTDGTTLQSHTDNLGNSWTLVDTDGGSSSCVLNGTGKIRGTNGAFNYVLTNSGAPPGTDYSIQGTLGGSVTAGDAVGILGRISSDGQNFYAGIFRVGGGMQLYKRVSGSYTQLGSSHNTDGSDVVTKLKMSGTSIQLIAVSGGGFSANQVLETQTDSSISAAGKAGVFCESSASVQPTVASFSAFP